VLASPPATKALDPDPFPCRSLRHVVYAELLHFGLESASLKLWRILILPDIAVRILYAQPATMVSRRSFPVLGGVSTCSEVSGRELVAPKCLTESGVCRREWATRDARKQNVDPFAEGGGSGAKEGRPAAFPADAGYPAPEMARRAIQILDGTEPSLFFNAELTSAPTSSPG
jgi:hypothetical protein